MLRLLRHLNLNIKWSIKFASETKYLVAMIYYIPLVALDSLIFVLLNPQTKGIVRTISTMAFIWTTTLVTTLYLCFSKLNRSSIQQLPSLNYYLFRSSKLLTRNMRIKIVRLRSGLLADTVGISCGGVFVFTRYRILKLIISFVMNFFLIAEVFRDYFVNTRN